ncbi:MAG: hypothetical protein ACI89T_000076 [Cognaticolwellia sp.]|jgi:hypothetical protein
MEKWVMSKATKKEQRSILVHLLRNMSIGKIKRHFVVVSNSKANFRFWLKAVL